MCFVTSATSAVPSALGLFGTDREIMQGLELLLGSVLVQDSWRWAKLSVPFQVDVSFIAKM